MTADGGTVQRRWAARPWRARAVRLLVYALPVAGSLGCVHLVTTIVGAPTASLWLFLVWWLAMSLTATAVVAVAYALLRRLLPLGALLELSLVFPDEAPSRFRLALRSGTVDSLEERLWLMKAANEATSAQQAAEILIRLAGALDAHDRITRGHAERVRAYSYSLGKELGLGTDDLDLLNWAALLHDIGKLEVSPEILNKPGRPTDEEWEQLRQHPLRGETLVAPLRDWLGPWAEAVGYHHERWDGKGYPRGIAGEEIPFAGRVVAIADVFDVITSARSYKQAGGAAQAREEITRCSGTQFDPRLVRAFVNISLGKMRLVMGPLSWLSHAPLLARLPLTPSLGASLGGIAALATAAATGLTGPHELAQAALPVVEASPPAAASHPAPRAKPARHGAGPTGRRPAPAPVPDDGAPLDDAAPEANTEPAAEPPRDPAPPAPPAAAGAPEVEPSPAGPPAPRPRAPRPAPAPGTPRPPVPPAPTPPAPTPPAPTPPAPVAPTHPAPPPSTPTVNDAPSFTAGANQTVAEDSGARSVAGWATAISPGPTDESSQTVGFTVSADKTALFSVQPAVAADGTLTFEPAADANGVATVTVTAHDDGGTAGGGNDTSAAATFTITITAVNDAPSFTAGGNQTVAEDSGASSVAGWATAISPGPSDESSQTVGFTVSADKTALFSVQPAVAADGTLTFEPAANANGVATVTVTAHDDGGTTGGGSDTSAAATFTITITAVNDAPSFTAGANQKVVENSAASSVAGWATAISPGPADESSQTVGFTVSADKTALFSVQPAVAADGTLTFTPAASANGVATVTVTAHDSGGGSTDTSSPATFTITIDPINQAPSFVAGADQTVLEDSGQSSVAGWATAISPGPADESSQTVSFTVSADKTALFSVQPAVAADGTLTFTPAADANGAATVTVTAHDDGGTAGGGNDTSAAATFTITITAVNDAPSFSAGPNETSLLGLLTTVSGWATGISPGPADESSQTVTFSVSNDNPGLFAVQPAVASDGTLTYTPALLATGTATVTIRAVDDGGTANGGSDTSAVQTFTISVVLSL